MSELQQLRDRVAELEEAIGLTAMPALRAVLKPEGYWLSTCETLCGMLMKRPCVPRSAAYIAIYGGRPECDQPDPKLVDVTVHRLRQALRPHGVEIAVARDRGWYLTPENKEKLRALIEAYP